MSVGARWSPEINEELFDLLDKHRHLPSELLSTPVSISIKKDEETKEVIEAKVIKPEGEVTPEQLIARSSRYLVLHDMGVGSKMEGIRQKVTRKNLLLDMARTQDDESKLVSKIIFQRGVDKQIIASLESRTDEDQILNKRYEFEITRNELYSVAARQGLGVVLFSDNPAAKIPSREADPSDELGGIDIDSIANQEEWEAHLRNNLPDDTKPDLG